MDAPTPDDIFPYDGDGLLELRERSAPWGTDDWEVDDSLEDPPSETPTDPDTEDELDSNASTSPQADEDIPDGTSRVHIRLRLLPEKLHLIQPQVHSLNNNSSYSATTVARPIKLYSQDGAWYFSTLIDGVHLPRPLTVPKIFKVTKPSKLMDSILHTWVNNGLLVPNPNLKYVGYKLCF